jgi:ABC-2 type transport system permease protein
MSARQAKALAPSRVLYRLFLTLFLRGSSARALVRRDAPRSIASKLGWTLLVYFLMGSSTVFLAVKQGVFVLSMVQHALTFTAVGLFVASSCGELLFNPEEAEILLHRPVTARDLLVAKARVMVDVSLWLALALNLFAAIAGSWALGSWWFPVVHAVSLAMHSVFCVSTVVLAYQLCLRWFGRERLQGLMTTAQIVTGMFAVAGFQILPHFMPRMDTAFRGQQLLAAWWSSFLPPVWFASVSALLMGERSGRLWLLGGLAVLGTVLVPSLALGRFARDYERGLQAIVTAPAVSLGRAGRRRWLDVLVSVPPLSWWFRSSVERAAFLLCAAYLARDRDTKLRVYPGIAPLLVVPIVFMLREAATAELATFGFVFTAGLLSLLPMSVLTMLSHSQQWRASDLFLAAPIPGPGPLCHGARRATLLFIGAPFTLMLAGLVWARSGYQGLWTLVPSILAMPLFTLLPCLGELGVPFSLPTEGGRSAGRAFKTLLILFAANAIAVISYFASRSGWLPVLVVVELLVGATLYVLLRRLVSARVWHRE